MAWQEFPYPFLFNPAETGKATIGPYPVNEQCFIRKQHKCGKMYSASKSCFIACPTDDNLEPILELMSEKLSKVGIEPIIAVKERAYGQDIFCTKICGKIIESRFCVVILDDSIKNEIGIPNPNVYYEYGLMTSLRKHIIPLQRENLELAFNIQSYDTIKYSPRNVATELDRAIRDAIKLTEAKEPEKTIEFITDRSILRRMELAGFEVKDKNWFLAEVIEDTAFKGFGQHKNGFYAYVGKIDSNEDIQTYIDDLNVAIYRTEKKAKNMHDEIDTYKKQTEKRTAQPQLNERVWTAKSTISIYGQEGLFSPISPKAMGEKIAELKNRLKLMSTIYLAFVVTLEQELTDFIKTATEMIEGYPRYKITFSNDNKLQFDDTVVNLTPNRH